MLTTDKKYCYSYNCGKNLKQSL